MTVLPPATLSDPAAVFACPACRSALAEQHEELVCGTCGTRYPVDRGVPHLAPEAGDAARLQAAWFDEDTDPEWEIERPAGAPRLYTWLMREKFARAVRGVRLEGATALVVCAGSGMDAEFLAEAGADVVAVDISPGAVERSRERALRHAFPLVAAVGDAERLPFGNDSFDVVYVHDGLHHLLDPLVGVDELARVARRAVCICEPARAGATALAVRLGLALDREDAGNAVARLDAADVEHVLRRRGFHVRSERFGMYYQHEPGRAVRLFSHSQLFAAATTALRLGNRVAGRLGNKLVVVGVRP